MTLPSKKRHLRKIPKKTFTRAQGDLLGGLIYIGDKESGIESGMVAMSMDSGPYKTFVESIIAKLESNDPTLDPLMVKRYKEVKKKHKGFQGMSPDAIYEAVLNDNKPREPQKRKDYSKDELEEMANEGTFHESYTQPEWVNKGLGGLLVRQYLEIELGKTEKRAWYVNPNNLHDKGNQVYLVKQDYEEAALFTTMQEEKKILASNTFRKMLKDGNIKGAKRWAKVYRYGKALAKHAHKLNQDAIQEVTSTKIMGLRGINSQGIELLEGTRKRIFGDKFVVMAEWKPGMSTFQGLIRGSEDGRYDNVLLDWETDDKGNVIKDPLTKKPKFIAQNGKHFSNANFTNLGECFVLMLASGDRDGIGKGGQNKGYIKNNDGTLSLFGFDYGKTYADSNDRLLSLRDDFSYIEPSDDPTDGIVNISMLQDASLIEKMKGVYLIAAMRGELSEGRAEELADQYRARRDSSFANKLIEAAKPENAHKDIAQIDEDIKSIEDNKGLKNPKTYIDRLTKLKDQMIESDGIVLDVFQERLGLSLDQLEVLEGLEKLTSLKVDTLTPDGNVYLGHLAVPREHRVKWQLQPTGDTFTLKGTFPGQWAAEESAFNELMGELGLQDHVKKTHHTITISGLTPDAMQQLKSHLSDLEIAQRRVLDTVGVQHRADAIAKRKGIAPPRKPGPRRQAPAAPVPKEHDALATPSRSIRFSSPPVALATHGQSIESVHRLIARVDGIEDLQKIESVKGTSIKKFDFKVLMDGNKRISMTASGDESKVRYTSRQGLEGEEFRKVCEKVAKIAVGAAEPNTMLTPSSSLSPEKREVMENALNDAINQAVVDGKFTDKDKPTLPDIPARSAAPSHRAR